jgi:aldose 1-epimerase
MTYGGIVTSLHVPDRNGQLDDVVLGFHDLDSYVAGHPYFGAITGRIAGRVSGGGFTLEGRRYDLVKNDGPNHLHGGLRGLDKRVWRAEPVERADGADSVRLTYHSPDGEEGYPGAVDFSVTYTLTGDNVFILESEISTDQLTPINVTHHSYFNLAGESCGSIVDHELTIFSSEAFASDDNVTPLPRLESVIGTAADFRSPRRLGDAIPGLFKNHGDIYLLPQSNEGSLITAARLFDPSSGRALDVSTNEPCLQMYTGAMLDGSVRGKSGVTYAPFAAICLECQGHSDAVNHPELDDILVAPDKPRRRVTHYAFSTEKTQTPTP